MKRQDESWKEKFIEELRLCGIVKKACAAAGVSRDTAYKARKKSESGSTPLTICDGSTLLATDGSTPLTTSFVKAWDGALVEAMERISSAGSGSRKRVRRLPALPREQWHDQFIEALRRTGIVRDACEAANITQAAAFRARKKSMRRQAAGESETGDAFAWQWDAAICEAIEKRAGAATFVNRDVATIQSVPNSRAGWVIPGALTPRRSRRRPKPRLPNGSWHDRFFAELRVRGIVKDAARAAEIDLSTAYAARRRAMQIQSALGDSAPASSFVTRWNEAIEEAVERLEGEAFRRSVDGYDKPVYYRGRRVGSIKRYSDALLVLLLKAHRPEKYRDNPRRP